MDEKDVCDDLGRIGAHFLFLLHPDFGVVPGLVLCRTGAFLPDPSTPYDL